MSRPPSPTPPPGKPPAADSGPADPNPPQSLPAGLQVAGQGWQWQRICESDALADGGDGVRFEFARPWGVEQAFVVRFRGEPKAYLNKCTHVPVELDWMAGRFFEDSGEYLMCSTHGALYEPGSGRCAGGPCSGRPLQMLTCQENDGQVWVMVQRQE